MLVGLAGLALYVATLAPTLLWGDDAELQRIVQTGEPRTLGQSSAASHLLWLAIARLFVRATGWLPLDAAGRADLVSALFAAMAVAGICAAAAELASSIETNPILAGCAAAVALGLSHTFWLLAVRPDVYTLELALITFALWGVLRWRRRGQPHYLVATALAVAGALLNHVVVLASVPGLALLVWAVPAVTRRRLLSAVMPAGAVLILGIGLAGLHGVPVEDLVRAALSYRPSLPLARDALLVPAYLLYQFPLSLPLAGWGTLLLWRRDRGALWGAAALYAGNALLMLLRYHPAMYVRDQYIFYLPSYVPVALLVGLGAAGVLERHLSVRPAEAGARDPAQKGLAPPEYRPGAQSTWVLDGSGSSARHSARIDLLKRRLASLLEILGNAPIRQRRNTMIGLILLVLLAPLFVYPLAATTAGAVAARLAPARRLPGRDPIVFYLLPPKASYFGARRYATQAMQTFAPGAAVVADWLLYQPLRYLQQVEGVRPDVELAMINADGGAQLHYLLAQPPGRPLYLADDSPLPYYELDDISRCFQLSPEGPIYRLQSRPGVSCHP